VNKNQKNLLVKQMMSLLDELVGQYLVHKHPLIKKSDNIDTGWGGEGKRKMSVNWLFMVEKPTRKEVESFVRGYVERMSEP